MSSRKHQPEAHILMFWVLAGLGTAAALPCFLVPPIEALQDLAQIEQAEFTKVQRLEDRLERQQRLSDALRSDPQVNVRLAQRELRFKRPGEVAVPLTAHLPAGPEERAASEASPVGVGAPAWVAAVYPQKWAPLYRQPQARIIILVMSLGLIVFALAIYEPAP